MTQHMPINVTDSVGIPFSFAQAGGVTPGSRLDDVFERRGELHASACGLQAVLLERTVISSAHILCAETSQPGNYEGKSLDDVLCGEWHHVVTG